MSKDEIKNKKQLKVKIDQNTCIKCGTCIALFPDLFEFDIDGNVVAKQDQTVSEENADEVVGVCPTGSISKIE
jgi:ferredoxin